MGFSNPQENISQFGLIEGVVVADLGAGSGHYTLEIARTIGEGGKVYAVDIQDQLLAKLKNGAKQMAVHNIEVVHGDIETPAGTRLREGSIDVALLANVLFQSQHKDGIITEAKRILKKSGRVIVIDWSESFGGMGPQPEHVFTEALAKDLFAKHGLVFVKDLDVGDHHYGAVFRV